MACVKPRRGKWCADWRDDKGRRYWKTFDTQEDANIFLGKVMEVEARHVPAPGGRADLRPGRRRLARRQGTAGEDRDLLNPAIGELRVDQVRVKHLEDFRDERRRKGLAPQTVNKLLTTASAILDYAGRHEYIERNPAEFAARCHRHTEEVAVDDPDSAGVDEGQADPAKVLSIDQAR